MDKNKDISNSAINQKVILFLAANPSKKTEKNLRNEHSSISSEFEGKNVYTIRSEFSVSIKEMNKAVVESNPFILHFVGSGDGKGLIFHNDEKNDGDVMSVMKGKVIFSSLKEMAPNLEIVILNSCFSESMAKVINEIGLTTIGISDEADEKETTAFSKDFYWRYIETDDIQKAFNFGKLQALSSLNDEEIGKYDKLFHLFLGERTQENKSEENEQKDGDNDISKIPVINVDENKKSVVVISTNSEISRNNTAENIFETEHDKKPEIQHKVYLNGDISKIKDKELLKLEKYLTNMGSQYQFGTDNSNYKLLSFRYLEGVIDDLVKCNDQLLDLDTSKKKYEDNVLGQISLEQNILDDLMSVLVDSNNIQSELYDSTMKLYRYLKKTISAISSVYLSSNIRPNARVNSQIIIPLSYENAILVTVLKKMKNAASKYFLN